MWDTTGFNDKSEWPEDGSQPFVLSSGDTTGYGQHADYVFGWKEDSLQKAMDNSCYITNCKSLTAQTPKVKNQCQVKNTVAEDINGCKCFSFGLFCRGCRIKAQDSKSWPFTDAVRRVQGASRRWHGCLSDAGFYLARSDMSCYFKCRVLLG